MAMKFSVIKLLMALSLAFFVPSELSARESRTIEMQKLDFANGLLARGMYDMAIEQYESFIESYPHSEFVPIAEFRRAKSFFFLKDYPAAENVLREFTEKYPDSEHYLEAKLRLAQSKYFQEKFVQTEQLLPEIIPELSGTELGALAEYYQASTSFNLGRRDQAFKLATSAFDRYSHTPFGLYLSMLAGDIARALEKHDEALEYYKRSVEDAEDESLRNQAKIQVAKTFFSKGEYERAEGSLEDILSDSDNPYYSEAALEHMRIVLEKGEYEKADSFIERYVRELDTFFAGQTLLLTANTFFEKGDYIKAREYFDKMIDGEFAPDQTERAIIRSLLSDLRSGELDRCITNAEEIIEGVSRGAVDITENSFVRVKYIRSKALAEKSEKSKALVLYKEIFREYPLAPAAREALYDSIFLKEEKALIEEALEAAGLFLERYPEDARKPDVLQKKGEMLVAIEEYADALAVFGQLIEHEDKEFSDIGRYQTARTLFLQGRHTEAIEELDRLLKESPEKALLRHVKYLKGRALQVQGYLSEAVEVYRKIPEDPQDPVYLDALQQRAFAFYQLGEDRKAQDSYYDFITLADEPSRIAEDIFLWTSEQLVQSGNADKANDVFDVFSKAHPDKALEADSLILLAEIKKGLGKISEAEEAYEKVVGLTNEGEVLFQRALLGKARCWDISGKKEKALAGYERAVGAGGDMYSDLRARYYGAIIKFDKEMHTEAANEFMMIAILFQDDEFVPRSLFKAHKSFEKLGEEKKAEDALLELETRFPDFELAENKVNDQRRGEDAREY